MAYFTNIKNRIITRNNYTRSFTRDIFICLCPDCNDSCAISPLVLLLGFATESHNLDLVTNKCLKFNAVFYEKVVIAVATNHCTSHYKIIMATWEMTCCNHFLKFNKDKTKCPLNFTR